MPEYLQLKVLSIGSQRQLADLEISSADTIAQLKEKIANIRPKLYPARVALRTAPKSKNIKDDVQVQHLELTEPTLYLKDLGPQVGWTTVFLTEYSGPLLVYLLFYVRPSLIYGDQASQPMHQHVKIAAICHTFHYAKRLLETLFVHRFSKGTMPIANIFRNSIYYWGFAAWMSYFINHPLYTPVSNQLFYPALAAFGFCELGNLSIHLALRNLRPAGTKVRAIPKPSLNPFTWLFSLVSCPNYTYESGAWISFTVMSGALTSLFFTIAGTYQMTVWALGKHRNYRKEFPDYPRQRKAIFPFIF
ncbi:hypothetical protein EB796_006391 [Bugula neritina]|uniref:TECR n=1 Tax=Bugula neritina TaxID=10212 RepID=A0A7J7KBT5_BUGNE|nr:hypothetical protein EB796_006391 [Bugula neritina]